MYPGIAAFETLFTAFTLGWRCGIFWQMLALCHISDMLQPEGGEVND